jgi:hypothetical protein
MRKKLALGLDPRVEAGVRKDDAPEKVTAARQAGEFAAFARL